MPALWPILIAMFVCYAPAAGVRGLWISPYVAEVHGAALAQIGTATLVMGLAMVTGNFVYGPIDRWVGSRKGPIMAGNLAVAVLLLFLWLFPPSGFTGAIVIFALIGLFGASYPIVISHGRSFLPPHLTGRGVTLLNLFGMGGAGAMQFASGPIYAGLARDSSPAEALRSPVRAFRAGDPHRHGGLRLRPGSRGLGAPARFFFATAPDTPMPGPFPLPRASCKRRAS